MAGSYRYDGTVAGLLTLLSRLLPDRIPESIGVEPPAQASLFTDAHDVETDEERATAFWGELEKRLPPSGLHQLRLVLLAEHPERELLICRYLLLVWEQGKGAGAMLAHPQVAPLWKLARQVGREAHRWLGFVRFREVTGGFYYAAMAPEHRVLPLMASHFAARFRDQQWVIHDVRHGEGLVHDPQRRQCLLLPMETTAEPEPTPGEERFQALWRQYFATLAIEARTNLKLQRSKVPLKVRPWLVEFGGR